MWAEIIGSVIRDGGELAAGRLAPPTDPRAWTLDAGDVDGMAKPLGRLAGRRLSFGEKAADYGDGIAAGLAFANYLIKNLVRSLGARAAARRAGVLGVDPAAPTMPPDVAAAYARVAADASSERHAAAARTPAAAAAVPTFAPTAL